MILYDFQCKNCNYNDSKIIRYSDLRLFECTFCGYNRPPKILGKSLIRRKNGHINFLPLRAC